MKGNVNANGRLRKRKQTAVIPFQKDNMWGVTLKKGYILYIWGLVGLYTAI